jgi:hypothetical protein
MQTPTAKEKYEQSLKYTRDALAELKIVKDSKLSNEYLKWVENYRKDAEHYAAKGDYATALEAIAYAHGFIDAGVLAGLFEIPGYHIGALK